MTPPGSDVRSRSPLPSPVRGPARAALVAILAGVLAAGAAGAADLDGLWLTETGASRVRIAPCGTGICGTIASAPGRALDANNPDPALRMRSVLGVRIFEAPGTDGAAYVGTLYNPSDGKTYSGSVRPLDRNTLEVTGCVLRVLCRRQTWTRVE